MAVSLKDVVFISRDEAEQILAEPSLAVISIRTPGSKQPNLDKFKHLLILEFCDLDVLLSNKFPIFDRDMAKKVVRFVDEVAPQVKTIICHCEAGVSRSAAIAKYIAEKFLLNFPARYSLYNKKVYQTLRVEENERIYGPGIENPIGIPRETIL